MKTKRLICGVGDNDSNYTVGKTIDGERKWCPYYTTWTDMIKRCYSPASHKAFPTYIDCTVAKEWHSFMSFRAWMITQDWKGKHLDKDIIKPDNKIYSPNKCVFVSARINTLLLDQSAKRGKHPIGVTERSRGKKKYRSNVRVNGKKIELGVFHSPEEAHKVYIDAKSAHIINIANEQTDPRVKAGLILHAERLRSTGII